MIKVLINGAFGRMGQATCKAVKAHPNLELVGQTGRDYDLVQSIYDSKAQVVVDFTLPDVVFKNANAIIDANARPVIGTSGLTSDQIATLASRCKEAKLGGIIAPNFSIAAVLMIMAAQKIVRYLPHVEIIEMHHDKKVDSPSGTAMRTAELLGSAEVNAQHKNHQHDHIPGSRGANHHSIPIHALRLPGILASQQIIFGETGETLTLRHDSIDRECFMKGVCLSCEKVVELNELIVGLENLL